MTRRLAMALAAVLAGCTAVLGGAPSAAADGGPAGRAPALCTASDAAIYTPPASAPTRPGALISCRQVTLTQVPGGIAMKAWKVQYASTDAAGRPVAVSGTVAVPAAAWTGGGPRPVVGFNPGTLGLGPQCAFSKQLAGAYQDEYEGDNIAALLRAGYAVAATDGAGYLDGQTHPYVAGHAAGHALLDIVRAAPQVPGSGLDARAQVGLWGYSEGGSNSLWAAQLAAAYAPELNVVGDASGGIPGELRAVAASLNRSPFAGFLADAAIGISAAYEKLPFTSLLNDTGREAVAKAKQHCLVGTIVNFAGADIASYTTEGYTLDELFALRGQDGRSWGEVLDEQRLGPGVGTAASATYRVRFPVFQYRGVLDEVIPTSVEDDVYEAYCDAGVPTEHKVYPGDHLLTDNQAVGDVVSWFGDRFAGRAVTPDC